MAMTVVLSLLIYILLFVNEAIADYDVCFRGGWPSIRDKRDRCIDPWRLSDVHKDFLRGLKYIVDDSEEVCPRGQFLCNPIIFNKKCF